MELTELQDIIDRHGKSLKQEVGLALSEQEAKDIIKYAVSEVFSLHVVGSSLPNRNSVISEIKKNLKEINEDKKVTNIDFDLGYSLGFFDGFDFNK